MATDEEDDDEFEEKALEWLGRIHRGAERGRQVAAARPDATQMADGLSIFCDLWDTTLTCRLLEHLPDPEDVRDDFDMVWHPLRGAPAQLDREWATSLPGQWPQDPAQSSLHLLQRLVSAALDHLRGLAILMRQDELVRAPVATARAALEACAVATYLIDSNVSPDERLRRVLNVRLGELEEARREAALHEDSEGLDELVEQIQATLAAAEECGMRTKWDRPWRRSFPHLPELASFQRMIEALLLEGLGTSIWRNMSSIAHNRESSTLLLDPQGVHFSVEMRNHDVALNTIAAVIAATELVSRLESHLGWDLSAITEFHPILLEVWSFGAGLGDGLIRRHLFGENEEE